MRAPKIVARLCRDLQSTLAATREEVWVAEAVAITGCGSDDLRRMTCPMLDRVIRTAWEKNGRTFKNVDLGVKTCAWYALVGKIESRLPRESALTVSTKEA